MYRSTTHDIEVQVTPQFHSERSSSTMGQFFWSYTIVITNHGSRSVQLLSRHWMITDANGRVQEVRGEGVVGEQPVIGPGDYFEYTSGVPLPTPSGFMSGSYVMRTEAGDTFDIAIPVFSLDAPSPNRTLN